MMIDKTPIFAEWVSGIIRIPQGELLEYVHMGFHSIYEKDFYILLEEGVVVKTEVVNNKEFSKDRPSPERTPIPPSLINYY